MDWYTIFPQILNMSFTGSIMILFVILARFFMKRLPKIYSYVLWGIVLFRLLCPVSVSSDFSLMGMLQMPSVSASKRISSVEYIPPDIAYMENPEIQFPVLEVEQSVNDILPNGEETYSVNPLQISTYFVTWKWLIGMACMLTYGVWTYLKIKRKLIGAISIERNIYMADHITSPFVMGIFSPRIYLLSSLSEQEQSYIILHEQHHIKRGDHIVKIAAYAALCIHWFNPLVWIAFVLASQDMEMSCDEAVVRKLGDEIRADYAASLLRFSLGKKIYFTAPLAFGEGDIKGRIRSLANWKRLSIGGSVLAVLLCVLFVWVGIANPDYSEEKGENESISMKHTEEQNEPFVVETFEETAFIDTNIERIQNTYYKMSDGTWKVDLVDPETGQVETRSYLYRIVVHGRIPNAAIDSNYILLSNRKDITFRQTWMASGFSSHMDDYFTKEEAVFVSQWLGTLESNHPQRDSDTIYVMEHDWGVTLKAAHATSSGLTLTCTQAGGNPTGELNTGTYYVLERRENGIWKPVDYVLDAETIGWDDLGLMIPQNDSVEWEVDWKWLYGELPDGEYRIGKEIMDWRAPGDFDQTMVYAEFEIAE